MSPETAFLAVWLMSSQQSMSDTTFVLRNHQRATCRAGLSLGIDPRLIEGVILAENILNRTAIDSAQDWQLTGMLRLHNAEWWTAWAIRSEHVAEQADMARMQFNKWPVGLAATGYVTSYGLGQVTPRTAIRACRQLATIVATCAGGIQEIVKSLLEPERAIYIVAAILSFEGSLHLHETGLDPRGNPALLATLYNMGGDYYRRAVAPSRGVGPNRFGVWVQTWLRDTQPLACR